MIFRYTIISVLLFSMLSCKPTHSEGSIQANDTPIKEAAHDVKPRILFLYFEVEKTADNGEKIELIQVQPVEGKMKKHAIRPVEKAEGNYIIRLLEDEKIVNEQVLKNPLVKEMEHYSGGDEVIMNIVELDKAPFFARFNWDRSVNTVKVYKLASNREIELFSQEIKLSL